MYHNVTQMMVMANGSYGPYATESYGKDTLQCRWVYGQPFEWKINGNVVSQSEAANWLHQTYALRRAQWTTGPVMGVFA